jgi:hypothetical protein
MADANESNNGKFDFCCRTTSSSSVSFPCFLFFRSPSQKYCETFAEVKECFGIVGCDNKLGLPVVQHQESGQWSPCSHRILINNQPAETIVVETGCSSLPKVVCGLAVGIL